MPMDDLRRGSFAQILSDAIADLTEHGFDSIERVTYWTNRLRWTAEAEATSAFAAEQMLREGLETVFRRVTGQSNLLRQHPGVSRFTVERLKPHMRAELDRRIMASANLIKLNRDEAIEKTIRRFQGWATSIPAGGSRATDRREVKADVKKPLASLPFVERRVLIDQGHKLTASISEVIARDGNAIAAKWNSHWRESGYDYRPSHKARDGKIYAIRGNWALDKGLMKAGPDGYYDAITAAAEEPFCRCYITWVYSLRELPDEMMTQKGRDELARVRKLTAAA